MEERITQERELYETPTIEVIEVKKENVILTSSGSYPYSMGLRPDPLEDRRGRRGGN